MAFNLQAFLKTKEKGAALGLKGDDLQAYLGSEFFDTYDDDWDSKPVGPPKTTTAKPPKTTIAQSAPKDAGTKPKPKPKPKPTSTLSDKDKLALKRLGGLSGGISLPNVDLGSVSQITETIKKKVTATDLSGGHSLNTTQDLSGGHSLNTTQDLSGGHSLNTEQDLSGGHSLNTKPFGNKPPKASTDLLQEIGDADQFDIQAFLAPYLEAAKKGLPPPGVTWDMPKVDLGSVSQLTEKVKSKAGEGLESISDAGTTVTEQIKEGKESINDAKTFVDKQVDEGKESATEFIDTLKTKATAPRLHLSKDELLQQLHETIKQKIDLGSVSQLTEKVKSEVGELTENIENTDITDPQINTNPLGDTKVDLGSLSQFTEKVKTDVGGGLEELKENIDTTYKGSDLNIGLENVQKEGQKAITQVKQEGQKLLTGDFNLENAVKGTISGIEDTYKGSDAHSVLQQVEDFVKDPTKGIRDYAEDVKEEGEAVVTQLQKTGKNIETTGQNILGAFEDTFNTGMNVSTALGSNAAKQVMKAKSDLSSALTSAFGSSKGAGPKIGKKTSIGTLLERDRDKRRGGLSRSGTSRTLITGKY